MSWEELYPVINEQAYYAVLRYDPHRQDKIQELVAQSYEKYARDISKGREVTKQNYKCFVTQRAKEVDKRSVCKKGLGGTSTMDVLSDFRRRPTSTTEVVAYDDWMIHKSVKSNVVEDNMIFKIDFNDWMETIEDLDRKILKLLMQGYNAFNIPRNFHYTVSEVNGAVLRIRESYKKQL